MIPSQLSSDDLCRALEVGWSEAHAELPREMVLRLARRWQAHVGHERAGTSVYRAKLELPKVRLLGASDVNCLIVGTGANVEAELTEFWQQHGGGGRMVIVLATSKVIEERARPCVPANRCVFFSGHEWGTLLTHPQPLTILMEHLRRQLPAHRLLPYDIIHPVAPNMFYGRREVLDRFHDEETTSFAIAGPGRIGKSSLLQQYRYELIRRHDDRMHHLKLIDCYSYGNMGADELAREIAIQIGGDSRANAVKSETLPKYLTYHYYHRNGEKPFELLLDEVDGVCESAAFNELADCVRNGICRVILCGKGRLYDMMSKRTSHFSRRLELIRPEPLDNESASRLLFEPLHDMGIVAHDAAEVRETVFSLTARRPQLIQECAKLLFQFAEADHTPTITSAHLDRLRAKLMERSHAMLPLEHMRDDLTRLLTLVWLRAGGGIATVGAFQRLAEAQGVPLTAARALDLCDDLWICNVLIWEKGVMAIASPNLVEFVRQMDFDAEIARLKKATLKGNPA